MFVFRLCLGRTSFRAFSQSEIDFIDDFFQLFRLIAFERTTRRIFDATEHRPQTFVGLRVNNRDTQLGIISYVLFTDPFLFDIQPALIDDTRRGSIHDVVCDRHQAIEEKRLWKRLWIVATKEEGEASYKRS